MKWSEVDTIVSDLTDADSDAFKTATRLIYANQAQAEVAQDIMGADGNWNYDDTNYTDFPEATTNLIDAQQDYSFNDAFLSIEGVSVKDANGNYQKLKPFDKNELSVDRSEYLKSNGMPTHYDKQGRSVFLYPNIASGSITLSEGLKVYFKRQTKDITAFGSTEPGFVSTEHMIIAYKIALPYNAKYHKDRVADNRFQIEEYRKRIIAHYSRRSKDEPSRIVVAIHSNK